MRIKKYSSVLFIVVALFLSLFSCLESTENNDKTPPTVHYISANRNDTILYNERKGTSPTTGKDTLYYDKKELNQLGNTIDILILGHKLRFRAEFSDNDALSSYYYTVSPSETNIGLEGDTAFTVRKVGRLFTQQNDTVNTGEIDIWKDFITVNEIKKPVREGDYLLKVYVVDAAGNESTATRNLKLVTRSSVLETKPK